MKFEITAETAAPAARVWQALIDVESWPRWMSSYTSVQRLDAGSFGVGSRTRVAQPGLKEAIYRVTALHEGSEFTWENKLPGLRTTARHVIQARSGGGTQIFLSVSQTGPLAGVLKTLLGNKVRRLLDGEADGLVRAGESSSGLGAVPH